MKTEVQKINQFELGGVTYVTSNGAAEIFDVSPSTFRYYNCKGYIPAPKALIGRTQLWDKQEIEQLQNKRKTTPGPKSFKEQGKERTQDSTRRDRLARLLSDEED